MPAAEPPRAAPPADPIEPPRTAEEEFWDEEPPAAEPFAGEPVAPAPPVPPAKRRSGGDGIGARARRHPLLIVAVLVGLAVLWFLFALFQPFHGDGSGRVAVTIPKGASVSEVGDLLDEKGVIASSTLFQIRVTLAGKRSELYPGRFTLAEGMSYGAAIDALTQPPVKHVSR